jgi:transposase-like protein
MDAKSARAKCHPTLSPAARGQALVDAWRQSGMSLSAFARQHLVKKHRIYYWSKRLPISKAVPTAIQAPNESPAFVQIPLQVPRPQPMSTQNGSQLEILFPSGALLRFATGVEPDLLRLVVQTVATTAC